ncbi:hypothetical protein DVT68_11825 [Dyella solisilvae]|uniref:Outer membrane porin, OprD family n=1 Tax=Dyella solisilvae TaxID=1920168 RepID=A0A370K940_9GAMM|nr:hypothetical protein [Dyella solisilvae]RDI99156.1 hypothetical protein DVT68_11825 [Dyella solisilvae]
MPKKLVALVAVSVLSLLGSPARASDSSFNDIFDNGHVDGELRAYDFSRLYDTNATPDAHAFSLAALINANTAPFLGGFSIGGSFAVASSLNTQSDNPAKIDVSLMGPYSSIGAFSQAYAQFANHWIQVRGGYQYLSTPWMGNNDSRVIPSSYNAISTIVTPATGWNLIGIRQFTWKSRTSTGMYADNLYYPSIYHGDEMYGNNGSLPATAPKAEGTWAGGVTYTSDSLKGEAWYYDFIDFARMAYLVGTYTLHTETHFNPFISAQYVNQNSSDGNILVDTHTKLFGVAGSKVSSEAWGIDLGTSIYDGKIDIAYNKLEHQSGAVGNGALISPYTTNYATDPLFTTSMIRGLVEQGPGYAWKARASYYFFQKQLQLVAAYAQYDTELRGNSHNVYFDIIYNADQWLKGLTIRNRWERSVGGANNLNPGNEPFTYNRLMITYKF